MKARFLAGLLAVSTAGAAMATDLTTVKTEKSVAEAMDALQAAVEGAGATVFARVDHQAGAANAGLEMDAAQVLIFGNPKLGTPAMNDDIRAALYLPLKVAVYQGTDGVVLAYEDPAEMFDDLSIPSDAGYLEMMQGALKKLTEAAAN